MTLEKDPMRNLNFVKTITIPIIDNVYIDKSDIHGFGLFSSINMESNKLLCTLDGQIININQYQKIKDNLSELSKPLDEFFLMECNHFEGDLLIVRPYRTHYSYINHWESPNAKLVFVERVLCLFSIKPIAKNEEIVIDYTQEQMPKEGLSEESSCFF